MQRYQTSAIRLATLLLALGYGMSLPADEPARATPPIKPPWQRLLQGDDARQAAVQERQLDQLLEAGKFAEVLPVAEALAKRRAELQGRDHWQAVDVRWTVAAIRAALRQGEEARREYAGSFAWQRQAEALVAKGRFREALPLQEKVLRIRRKVLGEEHPDTAAGYNNLAGNLADRGKHAEAAPGFARALAIYRKVLGEEHPDTAAGYNNVAFNLDAQGKYAEAAPGFARALAIRRKVLGEEHPDTAQSYSNVAANLNAQGKYAEATSGCTTALAIRRKVLGEEHPDTALSYNNVAANLNAQGKYAEAAPGYAAALAIYRKVLGEEHPHTATCYNNVAGNLADQGKYAEAAVGFATALAICRKVLGEDHPLTATCYHNVAFNLNAQGNYTEAASGYAKALAIRRKVLGEEHPDTARSYNRVAANLAAQGKYAEAASGYATALAIQRKVLGEEHPDTGQTYNNLAGSLHAQGNYAEAEDHWLRAADSFARARLRLAVAGLDRAAKSSEGSPLPRLAAVLARNGKPEPAWQRFEQSLARGTWDDLSARLRRPAAEQARQAEFITRLNRFDQFIQRTFTAAEATPEQLQQRKDLLTERRQVQDAFDVFARHLEATYGPAAGQVFDRPRIQASLAADTALIGWLDLYGQPKMADPNGEHWAVLLRATGAPVWLRLRGSGPGDAWTDADSRLPGALRAALHSPRGDWQPLAQRLRQQRLEPLVKYLAATAGQPAVRHLLVLPASALAGVPVEVFADGYTVSYALSGTLHAHLQQQPPLTTQGLLALADPVFGLPTVRDKPAPLPPDGDTWPPLPGTRVEIEALRRLFPETPPPLLLSDSEASEQRLYELVQRRELGQYRYLHFATHGEVNDRFPLQSALILARDHLPDPGQQLAAGLPVFDGRLTARKVLEQWHLQSELVTLSACQTALGKYESGEGFVGFAQALLLAGSRSVVLSQWKVDDAATALLMARFYQNLLGKRADLKAPMRKAVALAEAKAWLRTLSRDEAMQRTAQLSKGVARAKGRPAQPLLPALPAAPAEAREAPPYAHPYYWAAFVLIGDPD